MSEDEDPEPEKTHTFTPKGSALAAMSEEEAENRPTESSAPSTATRSKAHLFQPGQSGNPGGRSKRDREVEALFNKVTPLSVEILGQMAEQRDLVALQAILRHSVAPPKASTVQLDIGPVASPVDCLAAIGRITQAIAAGVIDPVEATPLIAAVEQARKTIETVDLAEQVRELQRQMRESGR